MRKLGLAVRWSAVTLVTLTCIGALGAAGRPRSRQRPEQAVVLVSLDGFHPDYLARFPAPNLRRLAERGVRARWLAPVFPTLTFPNHYSIVTGLLPAHHGIVGNHFVDPDDGARFRYSDSSVVRQSRWWLGEPLWVTAERQGLRAASFFWVGSEAEIGGVRPSIWKQYNSRVPDAARVDSALAWLRLPSDRRPRFVTLYFSEVDHVGHESGPDTPELAAAVAHLDSVIGRLVSGLEQHGLAAGVNVIVVSDHGMAPLSAERVVVLDEFLDRNAVDAISLGAFIALRPRRAAAAGAEPLTSEAIARSLTASPRLHVYERERTPERWRYRDSRRVTEVVGVPDAGWTLTTRASLAARRSEGGGAHGYDNADSTMRALFLASGPAFRRGVVAEPFSNLHVYELICRILGLTPAPNDGSLDSVRALLVP